MKQKNLILFTFITILITVFSMFNVNLFASTSTPYEETYQFSLQPGTASRNVTFMDTAAMVTDLEYIDIYLDYDNTDDSIPIIENGVVTPNGSNNDFYIEKDTEGIVIKKSQEPDFAIRFDRSQRSVITDYAQESYQLTIDYNFIIEDYLGNTIYPIEINDNFVPNIEGSLLIENAYLAPVAWTYWAEETATIQVTVFDQRSIYAGANITYDTPPYEGPTFDYTQRAFTFIKESETTNLSVNFSTQTMDIWYDDTLLNAFIDINDGRGQRDVSDINTNIEEGIYVFEGLEIDVYVEGIGNYRLDYAEYTVHDGGTSSFETTTNNPFTYLVGPDNLINRVILYETDALTPYIENYQISGQGTTSKNVTFMDTAAMVTDLEYIDIYLDYGNIDDSIPIIENGVITPHGSNNDFYIEKDTEGIVIKTSQEPDFAIRFDRSQRSLIVDNHLESFSLEIDYNFYIDDYLENTIYTLEIIDNFIPNNEGTVSFMRNAWNAPELREYWVEEGATVEANIFDERSIYAGANITYDPLPSPEITFDYTEKNITFTMLNTRMYMNIDFSTQVLEINYNPDRLKVLFDIGDGLGYRDTTAINPNLGTNIYVFEDLLINFKIEYQSLSQYGLDYYEYVLWPSGDFAEGSDPMFDYVVGPFTDTITIYDNELIPIELITFPDPNLGFIVPVEDYYVHTDEEDRRFVYAPAGTELELEMFYQEDYALNYWRVTYYDIDYEGYLTVNIGRDYDGFIGVIPQGNQYQITILVPEDNPPTVRAFLIKDMYATDETPDNTYQAALEYFGLWSPLGRTLIFVSFIVIITIPLSLIKADTFTYVIMYLIITTVFAVLNWLPIFIAFPIILFLASIAVISLRSNGGVISE